MVMILCHRQMSKPDRVSLSSPFDLPSPSLVFRLLARNPTSESVLSRKQERVPWRLSLLKRHPQRRIMLCWSPIPTTAHLNDSYVRESLNPPRPNQQHQPSSHQGRRQEQPQRESPTPPDLPRRHQRRRSRRQLTRAPNLAHPRERAPEPQVMLQIPRLRAASPRRARSLQLRMNRLMMFKLSRASERS